ncbi:MtrAB system histidine kinase MtrB [Compostimonas suwonensis]|uniref:Sensor histidine kinase MtrB n=1 Tax=Compostimonas suwonensis TaxID=1048394 RepID=A0A2M9BUQ6_9MICO|nr:MtrAB system histidine kinase MtrB [Compostimonas suwonensis]PJJ61685.1 two-component system sensor histidine kinase MtrB [Compostimonas suwonensis]
MVTQAHPLRAGWQGWRQWRTWPARALGAWRASLQLRTVTITVALSTIALVLTGGYMSYSIGNDLFQARLDQVLSSANRATASAQATLDASDASDRAAVENLFTSVQNQIRTVSSTPLLAVYRAPGQENSAIAPQSFASPQLSTGVITTELRAAVETESDQQHWQSVALVDDTGVSSPGIVVGSEIVVPAAGRYELYLAYSLSDAQATLAFVQRTLLLGSFALLILIGAVAWLVVRLIVTPIRVAAETSQKLAAGDLEVRIPEKGEDVVATLARSFNGMADSLQSQIKELAELSTVQQRFVSDVSHELRTPLTTIRLAGDVIYDQRESFPPATGRTAELLHTQVERFELLLTDLLEISRFDAGFVQLETEPTNLVRLAEGAIDSMHALAESKGSDVRLVAPGGYFDAEADPRRIRRIVRNLLGNAIEHGEGKPIVVSVDSNASAVALAVRDYGLGMNERESARVFDRFWRADPSRKRTIGGTGLGLAISLEDASLHSGWLEVWSRPGAGSCFRLTLPRVRGGQIVSSPLPLPPADAEGTTPNFTGEVTPVDAPTADSKGRDDA